MSRYRGPRLRITRRLGDLPGLTRKAAKRSYPPGQHGQARRKRSEYAIRLEEKQKLRFNYGISERQLVRYVKKARAQGGSTGTNLLKLLENRLDNMCFRLGFGPTVPGARQLVNHGHVTVNGRVVDIPSYQCKAGDVIAIRERKQSKTLAEGNLEFPGLANIPPHLELDKNKLTAKVISKCEREWVALEINELLVVEFYSRKV
ncbi:MAG: 30S ribosomal protein S4 [Cyanobacteria bacterium]|jgi:small subunit ribosomal protein S4|nr:30S ribosomal protein S4 [Cyanobacteriota bacterium]